LLLAHNCNIMDSQLAKNQKLDQIKYFETLIHESPSNRPYISLLERNQLIQLLGELKQTMIEKDGQKNRRRNE
jgi:hypothetical protein